MNTEPGSVLVVDDTAANRALLKRLLAPQGYVVHSAASGGEALDMLNNGSIDVVLLDLVMPGMDGIDVLAAILADPKLRDVPVLMVSAYSDVEHIARCIRLGAVDYISKPFDAVILNARVRNCVERRRSRSLEANYLAAIELARDRSRSLIYTMLPVPIADRMLNGEPTIADVFENATVLFADICGFTKIAGEVSPREVLHFLNGLFSAFDRHTAAHGLERVKTIGDAYMAVAGVPSPCLDHARNAANLALALRDEAPRWRMPNGQPVRLRIGLHAGPVIAGVVGETRLHYDLWGDTVNVASRMESHASPGTIQITSTLRDQLGAKYTCEARGLVEVKSKGPMELFYLIDTEASVSARGDNV